MLVQLSSHYDVDSAVDGCHDVWCFCGSSVVVYICKGITQGDVPIDYLKRSNLPDMQTSYARGGI